MTEEISKRLDSIESRLERLLAILSVASTPNAMCQPILDELIELHKRKRGIEHQIFAISQENHAPLAISYTLDDVKHQIAMLRHHNPAVAIYYDELFLPKNTDQY